MNEMHRRLASALLVAALAGCGGAAGDTAAAAQGPAPLAGARIGGPFTLTDQNGHVVTDRSFAGRYRVMYFGYTSCPDVCPTDAQSIGQGLRLLEQSDAAMAARVTPVFVSVDPRRDTPAVLRQFVASFHPRMVGLTGSPEAIAAVAREYAVFYHAEPATADGGYVVGHSRVAYLMGPDGRPIALIPEDQGPQAVAAALAQWVR